MDRLFEILGDPWEISRILFPIITFVLGFQIQKRLTRYKEYISRLHRDLNLIRDMCKQACIDASSLKPCLYRESGHCLEPNQELYQIVEYLPFRDKKLLGQLRQFLKEVDQQRNIFSCGNGAAHILVRHSSGQRAYHYISREGNDALPLPNLSDGEREKLLQRKTEQLREIFEGIDRRIRKLFK